MSEPLILIADDSREIRNFLKENVLIPAGYSVRSVEDGMSALILAREIIPDLLITDQQMPNLTGIELIQQLRRDLPNLPSILITSEGSESLVVEALRAGAVDFLTKPFEAEYLLAAVGRALTERRRWESLVQARSEAQASAEDLASRLHALEAMTLVGRTVTSLLDLDKVLTTVIEAAVRLTGAEEGSLLLVDDESGELYMRASKNFDEEFARTYRLHIRDSLAEQVISSGVPVIVDGSSPQENLTSSDIHSMIYVPLRLRGRVIGVLGVDNRKVGRSLTNQDKDVITAMADYAAIAIENSELFHRSEAERNKLETILTKSENGVIVTDPEDRLLLINRAAKKTFGVSGKLIGKPVVEIFEDEKLTNLLCTKGKIPRLDEIEVDEGQFYSAQRTPIEGVGQAIIFHNITHLKELDRIKSEFVTTVSHDLRSPLTAVLGYLELIERAGAVNEQQGEFIRRAQMSVTQITDLVNDLLELGRVEAGLDMAKEDTPLTVLARYAVEGLRGSAETKEITLEVDLQEFTPLVNGDPVRLRQMIGNLLDNAIKYTPEHGIVSLTVEAEGDQVILQIRDTGVGIPQADQPFLFDKFFRANNVPEDLPGTGLGLSIVKSIVDNHGGRIWVDSKLGEGATFTVVLPAVETMS
jgi:signal transduction histidine kinase/DNA-binding response OmpR family regulator